MDSFPGLRSLGLLLVSILVATAIACGSSSPPSSNEIVFVSTVDGDEEIYLLDADTGEARPLTDNLSRDFNPRLSPDGNNIAYLADEAGDLEVNLVDRTGEAITRLTHNLGDDQYQRWSPDGQRIAFVSQRDGSREIYLIGNDPGHHTRVTSNSTEEQVGDWSPDGVWLVFYGSDDEPENGLWLRNPDGVNLVRLTTEPDTNPVWSPNGQHIAFVRTIDGDDDIYIVSRLKNGTWQDGTELTRLTQHQTQDLSPVWSPDSKTIAFVSYRDDNAEIYTMRADGSGQRRLTINGADDLAPVWSPDGERIAFVSYLYGPGEIFVMGADGSTQLRMTNNDAEDNSPDW